MEGIRYLEKAFMKLDYSQLHLVYEALHERATLLRLAPHLSSIVSRASAAAPNAS
jgi:glycerol-3-phosphate dehydrogenase